MKNKIQIYAPLSKNGGREIETGFIASVLEKKYEVVITSLGNYYEDSDLKYIEKTIVFNSLNKKIYEKNLLVKITADLISFFKKNYMPNHFRISNGLVKRVYGIEKKKFKILKDENKVSNLIFICAQLSTSYVKKIIQMSKENNIPVIFRTTGTIKQKKNLDWCLDVKKFIHHSEANAKILENRISTNYEIIDQCSLSERKLLSNTKISKKINNFLVVSRLTEEKQIDRIIKAFNQVSDEKDLLIIYGEGPLDDYLRDLAKMNNRIIFKGFINNSKIDTVFKEADCFIISSKEEAGPITAIEAMAAGKVIISTKVGAMQERFNNLCFWYDGSVSDLKVKMKMVKKMDHQAITERYYQMRNLYLNNHSVKKITNQYLKSVSNLI
jgi:glycosyltransferase involved in cell wall biosynthesis